jgi:hypothetical protein
MIIDPDVRGVSAHFGVDAALIQAVVQAEGNIVRAVQCSIPSVQTREQALQILCRSAVHAMSDYIRHDRAGAFVEFWQKRWAPSARRTIRPRSTAIGREREEAVGMGLRICSYGHWRGLRTGICRRAARFLVQTTPQAKQLCPFHAAIARDLGWPVIGLYDQTETPDYDAINPHDFSSRVAHAQRQRRLRPSGDTDQQVPA